MAKAMLERFVEKIETGEGCWEWKAARNNRGYGWFRIGDKMVQAHRAIYAATVGAIPAGMCVCHRCDNPSCVRPSHLFLGTAQDNAIDMAKKHRGTVSKNGLPFGVARVGKGFMARLSHGGKLYYYGTYKTAEEASRVVEFKWNQLYNHTESGIDPVGLTFSYDADNHPIYPSHRTKESVMDNEPSGMDGFGAYLNGFRHTEEW